MQPQNNVQNGAPVAAQPVKTTPIAPQPATAAPVKGEQKKGNLFENAPKKKGKGMLLGLVFCILLAAGGIAFGVWTMMDSKTQKDTLNEQITTLKTQNSELLDKLENATTTREEAVDATGSENPIIMAEDPEGYSLRYNEMVGFGNGTGYLSVFVKDGEFMECDSPSGDKCDIQGLPGGVYKVATIDEGNGAFSKKIAFIMKDGSVWYASIYNEDGSINNKMAAKKLNIDGFVKDIILVNYSANKDNHTGTYGSTVFVLDNNSFIKYDTSMFN